MKAVTPVTPQHHDAAKGEGRAAIREFRYKNPGYVPTPTGERVMKALEFARKTPSISVVVGAPGVGKSEAARSYCLAHPYPEDGRSIANKRRYVSGVNWQRVEEAAATACGAAIYVSATQWIQTPMAILEEIAERIGSYPSALRTDAIAKHILQRLEPGDVIVIDEAQNLDVRALDGLRHFYDEGGIGIAYLGNEEVVRRIAGKGRRGAFAQLQSRVGMRLHITSPEARDVDAMLAACGVTGKEEVEFARELARMPGGLRTATHVIRQAAASAPNLPHFTPVQLMRAAAKLLGIFD